MKYSNPKFKCRYCQTILFKFSKIRHLKMCYSKYQFNFLDVDITI